MTLPHNHSSTFISENTPGPGSSMASLNSSPSNDYLDKKVAREIRLIKPKNVPIKNHVMRVNRANSVKDVNDGDPDYEGHERQ